MHNHVHTVSVMTETANRLLAALSPEQKAKVTFPFQDEESRFAGQSLDSQ